MRTGSDTTLAAAPPPHSTLRQFAANVFSLLASDVVNRGATFLLYLMIARRLGAHAFGQLSLAITLFHMFRVIAITGFRTLITREVAREPAQWAHYLVNGSAIAVFSSGVCMACVAGFVQVMGYAADTAAIVTGLALALLPYSLAVVSEAVFQAWEQMQYIAYANAAANVLKVGVAVILLAAGYGLQSVVALMVASFAMVACIEWVFLFRQIGIPRAPFDPRFALTLMRRGSAFLGINGVLAIRSSLNIILLSWLVTETQVGVYNAAVQFLVPIMLIYESIGLGVFPTLCRSAFSGIGALKTVTESAIELLVTLSLPLTIGVYFLAEDGVALLYAGDDFHRAVDVLRIIVWVMLLKPYTQILGRTLWASHHETLSLQICTMSTAIWFVAGLILIRQFGLTGAALNLVFAEAVDFVLHYAPISRMLFTVSLGPLIWKQVFSGGLMAVFLAAIGHQPIIVTVLAASLVYGVALLALMLASAGSTRQVRARYLDVWTH